MRNIRELSVQQIRLFPVDTIPQIPALHSVLSDVIGQAFQFQGHQDRDQLSGFGMLPMPPILPGQPAKLEFSGGSLADDDDNVTFITSLTIEGRRVVLQVLGSSQQADRVFKVLSDLLASVWPPSELGLSEVVYEVEETTCILDLDFDFTSLFRRELLSFIEGRLVDVVSSESASVSAQLVKFKAKISYQVNDHNISGHGITLSDKEFVIEPRVNTPGEARIFYTKSPLPSHLHLQFIREFEELFRAG